MTPSRPSPKPRKPHRFGGVQVRICGKVIQKEDNIVCTLPPSHHIYHVATAINDTGDKLYALVLTSDGDVQVWQIIGE